MGATPISQIESPSVEAPTVVLDEDDLAQIRKIAEGRHATGYQQSRRLQDQTLHGDGLEAHSVGVRAEAALCKYLNGDLEALDSKPSWDGDDGSDLLLRGYEVDVKCTTSGWDSGYEPLLRIERRHYEDPDHRPDLYYLTEECRPGLYRLIGYIEAEDVAEVGEEVDPGETFRGFTSRAENIVVPPEHLTMVERDWEPASTAVQAAD